MLAEVRCKNHEGKAVTLVTAFFVLGLDGHIHGECSKLSNVKYAEEVKNSLPVFGYKLGRLYSIKRKRILTRGDIK